MENVDINLDGVFDSRHIDVYYMHIPCHTAVTSKHARMPLHRAHVAVENECDEALRYL